MLFVKRIFHPVGQGGFFTEELRYHTAHKKNSKKRTREVFRVAYDCGSVTSKVALEKQINTFENKIFDVLFISHFDTDHINGLKYLLTKCVVEKVVLPAIGHDEQIRLAVMYSNNKEFSSFCADPAGYIRRASRNGEGTKIIFVKPYTGEGSGEELDLDEEPSSSITTIDSGRIIKKKNLSLPWVYIPFNFEGENRAAEVAKTLGSMGVSIKTGQDLKNYLDDPNPKVKDDIIKAFKKIKGGPNTNSLTLYSGPDLDEQRQICWLVNIESKNFFHSCSRNPACIYLGDYDAGGGRKWRQLYENFESYWHYVGTIQIPHHGAKKNFNEKLCDNTSMFCVIASGLDNRYKHPHPDTLKSILNSKGMPILVNESDHSICHFEIRSWVRQK
ncbi:hypothetical protein [Amphritea balenae]|uniref:MBL fold metallo-hydrolase n=1 Tax=Amphritea balenae TaxID=452629 RepID=A0A3P1SMA4_9GAMM|nr:hypothetical protein [Amphritea balenae]RRC98276.1 hypothetical protein EHS89_14385 [Amphritea balenae]GGK80588.1 MBL fold hydrolase [Amphritea balenae]